jgi:mRNA interferase YafQ
MLKIIETTKFKKDFKKIEKSKSLKSLKKFADILIKLTNNEKLPEKNRDHQLKGNLKEYRECHIEPDFLLMYQIKEEFLFLVRIGKHSEIFTSMRN